MVDNDTATITTGQPVLTLNSTSTMTLLPNISTVPLYLRLLAYDETGTSCAEDSAVRYYTVDSNGEILLCHSGVCELHTCQLEKFLFSGQAIKWDNQNMQVRFYGLCTYVY